MHEFMLTLSAVAENLHKVAHLNERLLSLHSDVEPLTIKGFCQRYPEITENTLRHWIRSNQSGFDRVYKKVGKSIYIDNAAFIDWFREL